MSEAWKEKDQGNLLAGIQAHPEDKDTLMGSSGLRAPGSGCPV